MFANNRQIEDNGENVAINLQNAVPTFKPTRKTMDVNLLDETKTVVAKNENKEKKKKEAVEPRVVATFKPEAEKKQPKISVILSGGYNAGSQSNGYSAGAALRKNVSSNVFIEGNVAFASSNVDQTIRSQEAVQVAHWYQNGHEVSPPMGAAKVNSTASDGQTDNSTEKRMIWEWKDRSNSYSYSLSYVQVNPVVGCVIGKRVSIGAGPDFEQALADNRPSDGNHYANQVMPLFDIGLIGKTEYVVAKNIKAGVSYRKGVNNVIAPGANYIDRDFLQFQVKCAVFNK